MRKPVVTFMSFCLSVWGTAPAWSQIATDGTMGPMTMLPGPNVTISNTLGTQTGNNLFHSFQVFNIRPGESATFTGPAGLDNVISRVTGGQASQIDGLLRSAIPDADFWFLNPAGVMFGLGAQVDVPGSLHVGTGDELQFEDGAIFSATTPAISTLTVASPQTFGFLDSTIAPVVMRDTSVQVLPGEAISLVGGEVTVTDSQLRSGGSAFIPTDDPSAGTNNLIAVTGPNQVNVIDGSTTSTEYGDVTVSSSSIETSGNGGGTIRIRAGEFLATDSNIRATNFGALSTGEGISIVADQIRVLDDTFVFASTEDSGNAVPISIDTDLLEVNSSFLLSESNGLFEDDIGNGGDITISAEQITLDQGVISSDTKNGSNGDGGSIDIQTSQLDMFTFSAISASSNQFSEDGTGNAGSITIDADDILVDSGSISSDAGAAGDGGSITITANTLETSFFGFISANSGVGLDENGTGDAGSIDITVTDLIMDGGTIASEARAAGDGGSITINADRINMSSIARIDSSSGSLFGGSATGNAGSITINTGELTLDFSRIVSSSDGEGDAGTIDITADGTSMTFFSAIQSTAGGSGNGGSLSLDTDTLGLFEGSQINSSTTAEGNAGTLTIVASNIVLDRRGIDAFTGIVSQTGSTATGDAGIVSITADDIEIRDGAVIDSSTFGAGNAAGVFVQTGTLTVLGSTQNFTGISSGALGNDPTGNAGLIEIAADTIQLTDRGAISSTNVGSGQPGAVSVNAGQLTVMNGSFVDSSTFGAGNAGSVAVNVDTLTVSNNAGIFTTASNPGFTGNAGQVDIVATDITVENGGQISSSTTSDGDAGAVIIDTGTLTVAGNGPGGFFTGIESSTGNPGFDGDAGRVEITADAISVSGGGEISSSTNSDGDAGSVTIVADALNVAGQGSRVASESRAPGDAGQLVLDIGDLVVSSDALVSSTTIGSGTGGSITLTADTILLDGGSLASGTISDVPDAGDGGSITVNAGSIDILNGGLMTVSTRSTGDGGSVTVDADSITIAGSNDRGQTSQIDSQTFVSGEAGSVLITADTINISDRGRIVGSTSGSGTAGSVEVVAGDLTISGSQSGVSSDSARGATGDAGSVTVSAETVTISDSGIISTSVLNPGMASSGNVSVTTADLTMTGGAAISTRNDGRGIGGDINLAVSNFFSTNGASVTTTTAAGDGGRISLSGGIVDLRNGEISTSVGGAGGDGGDITISNSLLVQDNSTIRANAVGGDGGNITIAVEQLIQHPGRIAVIEATSALGISGDINVSTPESDAVGGIVVLTGDFLDDTVLLDEPCITRVGEGQASSLVPSGRGGLPASPDNPGSGLYFAPADVNAGAEVGMNSGSVDVPMQQVAVRIGCSATP